MKTPRRLVPFLFVLVLGLPSLARAGSETTSFPADQVIETKMDLGLFGIIGGGMNYSIGGKPINRLEDLQTLIYPLRDEEATRLLYEAQECHFAAWMLYVTGTAVGLDVGLSFKPVPLLGVDWFDRMVTGVVSAEIPWGIGALFDAGAEGRKFNAIQRYNNLILRKKDQASLDLKPQLTLARDGPRLGLSCSF